jgi:hypothetical protein
MCRKHLAQQTKFKLHALNDQEYFLIREYIDFIIDEADKTRESFAICKPTISALAAQVSALEKQVHGKRGTPNGSPNKKPKAHQDKLGDTDQNTPTDLCNKCGCFAHDICRFATGTLKHPDVNDSVLPWNESPKGILYKRLRPNKPRLSWDAKLTADNAGFEKISKVPDPGVQPSGSPDKKGTVLAITSSCTTCASAPTPKRNDVLMSALYRNREGAEAQTGGITALTLLDTGALDSPDINLISRSVADKLVAIGGKLIDKPNLIFGLYNACRMYTSAIELDVTLLYDEAKGDVKQLSPIVFQIVDSLPKSEVIICQDSIEKQHLLCRCMTSVARQPPTPPYPTHHSQWSQKPNPSITASSESSVTTRALYDHTDSESESDEEAIPQAQFKRRNFVCAITVGGARRAPGFTQHVSELLNFEPFSLGEPEKEDALDEALQVEVSADTVDFVMPENIVGTRAMKRNIKRVLEKYASAKQLQRKRQI